jgi:uncharacterized membrane protein
MKAAFLFVILPWIVLGCNAAKTTSTVKEPTDIVSSSRQALNQDQIIYFRAAGNEPFWSLKISDTGFSIFLFYFKNSDF